MHVAVPILKVTPEEAIHTLDQCTVDGFKLKQSITAEYRSFKTQTDPNFHTDHAIPGWQERLREWMRDVAAKLEAMYISQKYAYIFAETTDHSALSLIGENDKWYSLMKTLQARIDVLIEFENFINQNFQVHYEVVLGDKYQQDGDGNKQEVHQ